MELRLEGKNALVCGSSQGIGRAIAVQFAKMGANVTLVSRNEELLKNVLSGLDTASVQKHEFITADFTDPSPFFSDLNDWITGGKVYHILVNNTGGPAPGFAIDAESEEFTTAFQMHLVTSQKLAKMIVPGMKSSGYGRIINVISIGVKQPITNLGVSNTIRGAMASWGKTLATELGPYGITVNNLLPGHTNTERLKSLIKTNAAKAGITIEEQTKKMHSLIPAGRFARPEELAYAAGFLASDKAAFINGINLPVDGGFLRTL